MLKKADSVVMILIVMIFLMQGEPYIGMNWETRFWIQIYVSSMERQDLPPSFQISQGAVDTVLAAKQSTILPWMNHSSMGVITALISVNIIDE